MIAVDSLKCIGCGLCNLICPAGAIAGKQVDSSLCIRCGQCMANCPEAAIAEQNN